MGAGASIARVLTGAWRVDPPEPELQEPELARVSRLLLKTGAGGLAWWRIRNHSLAKSAPAAQLQQAFRLHTLQTALLEESIPTAVQGLRAHGIEPLFFKGWAIARHYPAKGLRPYGDLDLAVRPEEYAAAEAALLSLGDQIECGVDLHAGSRTVYDREIEELFDQSRLEPLGDCAVRLPSPEDHLRILSLHMLDHGAWRPLWLCDVAVAVERRPPDFDWEACLRGSRASADGVLCAVALAHVLLGCDIRGTPAEEWATRLPRWVIPAVLRQWATEGSDSSREPLSEALRQGSPGGLQSLAAYWRNPIQATVEMRAPFNEFPRLPLQVGAAAKRVPSLLRRLARREKDVPPEQQ